MTTAAAISASFSAAVLRGLDELSREAIARAGAVRDVAAGETIYAAGDPGESFFVVLEGQIELSARRRGSGGETAVRLARRGDTFGEEATLPGLSRRAHARATESSTLAQIPIAVFRRATERSGGDATARERRYLHRAIARDAIDASALGARIDAADRDVLLDAARLARFRRDERVYESGDEARFLYVVAEGLVHTAGAHYPRGDLFGADEVRTGALREHPAEAMGDTWCIRIPADVVRKVARRHPHLFTVLQQVARRSAALPFADPYRLQVAQSLLVIDQDACVRCGHCSWSCGQVHGHSRLVRRGDKIDAQLVGVGRASLSMPSACQHCRSAACMLDCPTAAIGRGAHGQVVIREDLCTGCGNCAKECPWGNIAIAPNTAGKSVAVKCDLCTDLTRGAPTPACVQACPTDAVLRIDPSADLRELAHNASAPASTATRARDQATARAVRGIGVSAALALGGVGLALNLAGTLVPGAGIGFLAGAVGAVLVAMLAAYAIPKRMPRHLVRMRGQLTAHVIMGAGAAACVVAHAGARASATPGGALYLAFWTVAGLGGLGTLLYRVVPPRLSRLEATAALPEDIGPERRALLDLLFRTTSGKSELVKTLADRVLVPYALAPFGAVALLLSGRSLAEEKAALRSRIDTVLRSRGSDRLDGLDELIDTVVKLRAVFARRVLSGVLRGWLPLHIVATAMTLALLVAHIATAVLR